MTPIEDGWNALRKTLPETFSAETLAFTRAVYFSGALRYRDVVKQSFTHDDPERVLVMLAREMRDFKRENRSDHT